MLAAAIPVIAYDAAGPSAMLTPDFIVPIGGVAAMTARVNRLLADPGQLQAARGWARSRAAQLTWERVGQQTARAYEDRMTAD
jgi:glycosyltransferase involved in cell wall biosynthesis